MLERIFLYRVSSFLIHLESSHYYHKRVLKWLIEKIYVKSKERSLRLFKFMSEAAKSVIPSEPIPLNFKFSSSVTSWVYLVKIFPRESQVS